MNKRKKLTIYISSVVITLVILFSLTKFFINNSNRKQIPELPDFTYVTTPVQDQLSAASKKAFNSPTSDNIGMLGMAYHSSAFYDQAIQCYQLATTINESEWIWNYYLAYMEQEMGDTRAAIENFKSVINENPEVQEVWYYLGKAYLNSGSGEMAEEALKKIAYLPVNNSPINSDRKNYSSTPSAAKFELARMYLNSSRLDEAEKLLKEIINDNKTIGPVFRLLGNVYGAKGDSALSEKYIVRAKDLPIGTTINDTLIDRITLISRSELYLPKQIDEAKKTNNPEWASILFKQAFLYLPDNNDIILNAIKFFLQIDEGEKAIPYLSKNFKDYKDNFSEMREIANLLYLKRFYSQAVPFYIQSLLLKPESFKLGENLALCYWRMSKKDSALILMSELYEKNKINPEVLANEVDFMLTIGDKSKAKYYLQQLRQIAPSDPKFHKLSGVLTEMEGNLEIAIPLYEAAFRGDPTDLGTIQKLGNYYMAQRLWSKAIPFFRKALDYHPNESIILESLGTSLITCPDPKLRNIEEGLELSERAYFHYSSSPITRLSASKNLALGNVMIGDYKTAASYMEITLNIAKREKVSKAYMDGLLILDKEIKRSGNNN